MEERGKWDEGNGRKRKLRRGKGKKEKSGKRGSEERGK